MQKIANFYIYRRTWIHPYSAEGGLKGWTIDNDDNVYKTLDDAQNAIDKRETGSWWNGQKCPIPKRCDKPIKVVGKARFDDD